MTTIGRGRGRGRGNLASKLAAEKPKSTQQIGGVQTSSTAPTTRSESKSTFIANVKSLSDQSKKNLSDGPSSLKTVKDITVGIERLSFLEVLDKVPSEMLLHKTEKSFEELVEILCEKSLNDPDFAVTVAKLCNHIWINGDMHHLIRNPLLTIVQRKYSKREELKKKSREKFYGFCVFLCELYKLLKLKEQPLKPLTVYVCQILQELVEDEKPSVDDVLYFYQELESVGSLIESADKERMESLINHARLLAISSPVESSTRCRLVQLIELHAANWKMKDEIKLTYEDLQQDLFSEGR